jgi:hypothetical protein
MACNVEGFTQGWYFKIDCPATGPLEKLMMKLIIKTQTKAKRKVMLH